MDGGDDDRQTDEAAPVLEDVSASDDAPAQAVSLSENAELIQHFDAYADQSLYVQSSTYVVCLACLVVLLLMFGAAIAESVTRRWF
jgi:hypothetical protein